MSFDTSMVMDYVIPDSLNDFGAILLWILILVLGVIVIFDIRLYLNIRNMSKKEKRMTSEEFEQKSISNEQMKTSTEDRIQKHLEIRNKVDKIIESNNL